MYIGPLSDSTSTDVSTGKTREDIRTADIPPRLAEDGDHIREYPAILHNTPVREVPAVNSAGKRFGTNVLPETISVDGGQARVWLALHYGYDVADSMLGRATATGMIVNGEMFKVQDSQATTKGKLSVTTDNTRPGCFVLVPAILKQSGARRK